MIKKISVIASICIVIVIGAFLFYFKQQNNAERAHMAALQSEAKVYEDELTHLIENYKKMTTPSVDFGTSMVLIGFYTSGSAEELNRIPSDTPYTPIIVSEKKVSTLSLKKNCELVSAGNEKLSDYRFLRLPDDSDAKRKEIKDDGYTVCIRYKDACKPGVDGDLVYLNYGMIQSSDFDIRKTLDWLIAARQPFLYVFDLSQVPDSTILENIERIQSQVDAGILMYGNIASASDAIQDYDARLNESADDSVARKAEYQAKIDELQAKIDEIYSQWGKVD